MFNGMRTQPNFCNGIVISDLSNFVAVTLFIASISFITASIKDAQIDDGGN